jgi:hypothetical protein
MTCYQVEPRKKDERGIFAIYPQEGCFVAGDFGRLNLETELARVKARTGSEAVKLAGERKIGEGLAIWAIEVLDDNRVTVLE